MGQSAAAEAPKGQAVVDTGGLNTAEYAALRRALRVERDAPDSRVELADFVAGFPTHLRPLLQPLFFSLGKGRFGEPSVAWPSLVLGLASVVRQGATWQLLLEAWAAGSGDSGPASGEAELHLELAASLCFWCAHPELQPVAIAEGDADHDSTSSAELEQMLGALRAGAALLAANGSTATLAARLETLAPQLPRAVGPRLSATLLAAPPQAPVGAAAESRALGGTGLALLLRSVDARLWESGVWEPLYRDWRDGRSFNALLKGALHYEGPALLLVRTAKGEVIGALSTCWEEGNGKFGGNSECLLFSLLPALQVMRSGGRSGNYVYLNSRNKHAVRGLGFGGQLSFFRLWIDADFEECYALQSDATYERGQLLAGDGLQVAFHATVIEVWACGGEESRIAQEAQRHRAEGAREAARKVDRAKLLENEFDKEMFLQNTFKASEGGDKASAT